MDRKPIAAEDFNTNIFHILDKGWMLLTAGDMKSSNPMTISWGFMGTFWFRPVVIVGVRPQRYTFEFIEKHDSFTLSAFPEEHREVLNLCGTKSGRDTQKVEECNLTPIPSKEIDAPGYDEADLIIECRKIYADAIEEEHFLEKSIIDACYPGKDFHKLFFGEVVHISGTDKYLKS